MHGDPQIGWGLIGASTVAAQHMVAAIRAQPGHAVVAVASRSAERAARFGAAHGIGQTYGALSDLLADPRVGVVYVSAAHEWRRDQVLAAAAAGKHVLCEKPLALTVDDARAMARACRKAGVVLATNHHLRGAATHRRLRELVRGGAIGLPLFARVFHAVWLPPHLHGWRLAGPQAGGGVVLDITVHDADALRFILGAEPVEAVAMGQQGPLAGDGVLDGVMAVLRMDNGVLAQLHAAFTIRHAGTGIEIHGSTGSLIGRDVMTQRAQGEVLLRTEAGEQAIAVEHGDLYARGVAAFCAALRGEGEPAATAEDGVRSLAAALAVAEACRTGRAVPIAHPLP